MVESKLDQLRFYQNTLGLIEKRKIEKGEKEK